MFKGKNVLFVVINTVCLTLFIIDYFLRLLTTVGYGDICQVTAAGRAAAMISTMVGVAAAALSSGIITAGYMDIVRHGK